ncbi:CPBP family glutamic-type intramembrane protease [Luteibacter yeojuensis]|uniref:CAAX prenyl protease 2/Lysostaphin resistance protein A-like domain-containing protein n=1 Tax=Luteibacter yeojuensis TaxID=345309 RepID=A0A7X5QRH8_9GAMM|nr:CPBP family glutamic-type intramembrane protease [Luteibacter yeojuensis]NID14049.1 hypothetical protein [Luteibacter yeojuensis]
MPSGGFRWTTPATVLLGLALLVALPYLAAAVVRAAIESRSAADRAAYATGGSPWSWRFREADDVVAGRAFGGGSLGASQAGLILRATDGRPMEVGLPLARVPDLVRLDSLEWRARASATGVYGLAVRETLDGPLLQAPLGKLGPKDLSRPISLRRLAWTDDMGHRASPPTRAAMLRLRATLPAGATLVLDQAALRADGSPVAPRSLSLPPGLSAEGLLAWRDTQRAADPLVTFGTATPTRAVPPRSSWIPPVVYLALLALSSSRRRKGPSGSGRSLSDPIDAVLVLTGPLWFIAGLGLGPNPATAGIAMFVAGTAYAFLLASRRILPGWHWLGTWRAAAWPLLAVPVAFAIVLTLGHAPLWPSPGRILLYVGWAFFQQWLVLAVVGALLARVLPRSWAALFTALAFALLHTPNGLLMQLCFVAELGWAWWYFHRRALLPVAVAHAASAVLLQAGLAGGLLRSLEVSARFLQ